MKGKTIEVAAPGLEAKDLGDGQMRRVQVAGAEVLLVRRGERIYAVSAVCPHWGGPLEEGTLSGDCVVCPWHKSRFDFTSGNLREPPALDDLARYEVRVEGQTIYVKVPEGAEGRRPPPMVEGDPGRDQRTLVILGAGAAGYTAAQTLREAGFQGRVVLISDDPRAPYDRPQCSKQYMSGEGPAENVPLRGPEFYARFGIELVARRVQVVDGRTRTLQFEDGTALTADALLLATGAQPRVLRAPGAELPGVFTLRTMSDTDRIVDAASAAKHAVIVGASFIGMEVAASLKQRFPELKVTVVAPSPEPFAGVLGLQVGRLFRLLQEEHGVAFALGTQVAQCTGSGRVERVRLENGTELPAELVVVGIGVEPATDYLEGVPRNADGSVTVDTHMRVVTGGNESGVAPGLFAAGDIATFPDPRTNTVQAAGGGAGAPQMGLTRIEHWRVAQQQGRVAALNMLGQGTDYKGVPYFWTYQFDVGMDYLGHADDWDELVVQGDLAGRKFIAYYVRNNVVLAAAAMGMDRALNRLNDRWREDEVVRADEFREEPGLERFARREQEATAGPTTSGPLRARARRRTPGEARPQG